MLSTDCGEEEKDTSTITCDTTDVDIHRYTILLCMHK